MVRRKRRRLKKSVKLFLYLLLLSLVIGVLVLIFLNVNFDDVNTKGEIKEEKIDYKLVIDEILSYNVGVDKLFLEYIYDEYGIDVLLVLNDKLKNDEYSNNIWHEITGNSFIVLNDKYNGILDNSDNIRVASSINNTISFVGDVSLADDWYIAPKYDERGKGVHGILSESVVDIMKSADVMIANNEFTISNRGSKMPKKYYTFRAKPERLSIYDEMGVDLVTLANNHIFDYGEDAFLDALDHLKEYDMPYIGAGRNIEEASRPYYFIVNGYKIGFVNATRAEKYILTPGATDTNPGVFRCYDPTNFINVISETKKNSDYVIALVHFGKEDSTVLEDVQVETSRMYIDAGADLIVGSHAHILQGIDFYNGKAIMYNLGDFIFNHESKDTAIFELKINDDGSFEYNFIPCRQDNMYTYLLEDDEKLRVINNIRNLSSNVIIEDSGKFYSK